MIEIAITNQQAELELDRKQLNRAVRIILEEAGISSARVSLAVVDDPTMARLHEQYLAHQGPTDVLSFLLEREGDALEGEVVVGASIAKRQAISYGWPAENELLLYVIHGTLHLVGHDDATDEQRAQMRERERACLAQFGIEGHYDEHDELKDA